MIDWLKFFPFKWEGDNKPKEIRGPYFPAPVNNKWFLQDCALHFRAPQSNPVFGFSGRNDWVNALSPGSANILKTQWDHVSSYHPDAPPKGWSCQHFYDNTWKFVGPWFTGFQAELSASALLICTETYSSYSDKNLFHPRVFESAVSNYLDTTYGYHKNSTGTKPHYRGPLNWHVLPISDSIQAIVCDLHTIGNSCKENPGLDRHVYFPITAQKFIKISFDFGGTDIYRDDVKAPPLFKLCDAIIDSLRLDVGEPTQAEWDKVKSSCPDMSLTEEFAELPWPLKVEKKPKKVKDVDVTPTAVGIENS